MSDDDLDATKRLTPEQTATQLAGTAFVHLRGALHAAYTTADFASAAALVARVGEAADALDHHPDVSLGWGSARFVLSSHDSGGVTARDLALAQRIQELADAAGATAATRVPGSYDIGIDTVDADGIRPFWKAAFDYEEQDLGEDGIDLVDPRGVAPKIWFQRMDPPRLDRNRIHFDVYVPFEDAEARVEAVLEAGGTLMTDEFAPNWWVLADAEGNEVCICTSTR
ncbi:4a-hydroxytetrahydrobiopterin dehydratase [Homoserinimonas aerilata]|uniref:Putative pterin-4-alpha-carbinolamine dehydratase n=1 Tax=Homoserinimonas aerilata TaxID=1162970 RepID=A0A542YHZ4_9MICO|nr:VOC family protein [Homoserinimonas aerilata]TQL47720.1 4a-hydroxytetrahydrobiopterin dehydratase [Homoserinimonas aerilata]